MSTLVESVAPWQDYIGRQDVSEGVLDPALLARFQATLDLQYFDGALPLGIHWCVGVQTVATSLLGPDGHPPKGGFLPPVDLPRRMWAGGSLDCIKPLYANQHLRRVSRIADVVEKHGRSGSLVFVTVTHEITADGELAIKERQDIVYRPADLGPKPEPLPASSDNQAWVLPTTPLLFRYSALTFNSHRIHYDLPYAQESENYPGLVVHGPLQATLLADAAARALGRPLSKFTFRGQSPAFADHGLGLDLRHAENGDISVQSQQFGKSCMVATAS